uniref:SCO family protein n=1 Tax=Altererythrobacter segetis TaxID=1104773 RepID=UPI00140972DE|nr:SCO family protein [Altererythrobacter segetis]
MIARLLALVAAAMLAAGAVDPNDPFKAASIVEKPGASIPLDGPFVTSAGQPVTLRQLAAGKPLLITPVQHECPNICGVTLAGIAGAIDGQPKYKPGRDFAIVALGIDPREGSAQAGDDLKRLAAQRPNAVWQPAALTGSEQAIHAVTDALGYRYAWSDQLGQYAHLSGTAVLTPDGRMSSWLYGLAPTSAQLQAAVTQASAGRSGGVMQQILLLCFHYDPQTGRYSLAITKALRLAGVATVLLIALAILLLSRRRRTA